MNEKEKVNQITEGVIWKQLLLFFFPIVFGTFFQQIYNTADTIVVGRFVGKQALAAVGGSASQIANLIVGFFVGLSSGAAVVISQFYGAKDKKNLSKALHTAFAFSIAAGIVLTVVGIFLTRPALLLMKTPADVVEDSAVYLHIYFGGMVFNLVYNMGAAILRAVGDSKRLEIFLPQLCYNIEDNQEKYSQSQNNKSLNTFSGDQKISYISYSDHYLWEVFLRLYYKSFLFGIGSIDNLKGLILLVDLGDHIFVSLGVSLIKNGISHSSFLRFHRNCIGN